MMETGLTYTSTVVVSKENVAATMGSKRIAIYKGSSGQTGKSGSGNGIG